MPGIHGESCSCANSILREGRQLIPDKVCHQICMNTKTGKEQLKNFIDKGFGGRLEDDPHLESIEDQELVFSVNFADSCNLTSFAIIGGEIGAHPAKVRLFINPRSWDFFDIVEWEPTKEIELAEDFHGMVEYPLNGREFNGVREVVLHFKGRVDRKIEDENQIRLHWVGIKGEAFKIKKRQLVATYELQNVTENVPNKMIEQMPAFLH